MTPTTLLSQDELEQLRGIDGCTVANAIETFNVRLRNEGFANSTVRCQFPKMKPMVGYAVTGRIRASSPPMTGRCYYDRIDFWRHVLTVPPPRVLVMQDVDRVPGIGALVGEVHARIGLAMQCVGFVSNGAVRDLEQVEATGFQLFSGSVAVSHAYAHIVEFGEAVEVGGMRVRPGDLIHGDRNGVQTVPMAVAREIPRVAAELSRKERELFELCESADFTVEQLARKLQQMS